MSSSSHANVPLPTPLGFLASHGGSGAKAIAAACQAGELQATPAALASNNSGSAALAWARAEGLATAHISGATHGAEADAAIAEFLRAQGVEVVVLSGYMKAIGPDLLSAYEGRILNIHPALLPKHGGHGLYGDHVHTAVLEAGETESGATVHLVTAGIDEGSILAQSRVPVLAGDTLATLRARVQASEGPLYVRALREFLQGL